MSVRIEFSREISKDCCVEETQSWSIYIEGGDVVKISYYSYTSTPTGSYPGSDMIYYKGKGGFDEELQKTINLLYRCDKKEYNRLLEALNKEVTDRYFQKEYVPK